jgi:hypothetical protein
VEDYPDPTRWAKENTYRGSVLPVLNKKLDCQPLTDII